MSEVVKIQQNFNIIGNSHKRPRPGNGMLRLVIWEFDFFFPSVK